MRADGHKASTSTVQRALRRRGLLLPVGYRADRRSWARLRRTVFHDPPRERNRVWQTDFSEFETTSGGIWRICAVIDYATKYCLAATVTPTSRGVDALAGLRRAVAEAQRLDRCGGVFGRMGGDVGTPSSPRPCSRSTLRVLGETGVPRVRSKAGPTGCRSSPAC
jgi:transposase InsO family protein